MRLTVVLLVLFRALSPTRALYTASLAAQTFFIPMPEEKLFLETFKSIHGTRAVAPIHTMISVTVSTDNTVIFYDHWEDGYDADATQPSSSSTEIWGDGNAANGCAPRDGVPCTDQSDVLMAGEAIIITNEVPVPRDALTILYDGGDRIQASYPIAVTRGAFPEQPGSLMAGAIEVLDTSVYGKEFQAPCGSNTQMISGETSAFQYVVFYILASEDDTVITYPGGTKTLNMGETEVISILQSDKVTATKPVMVDLITGDKWSTYELRWFSLLASKDWSNEYLSSVGDSVGQTKVLVYNGNDFAITVNYEFLSQGAPVARSLSLEPYKNAYTETIPTGSGAHLKSEHNFIALSFTDTVNTGQIYDWGFPVMPVSLLTTQVVIGMGFGCTANNCGSGDERSVVWISALEDCYVHADYDNNGNPAPPVFLKALESKIFMDDDQDMSGALLYATKTSSKTSSAVPIAAAWGQNPAFSGSGDPNALDLGTVVLPFPSIHVTKSAQLVLDADGNGHVSPGDTLQYTIQIVNLGQVDIPAGDLTIVDHKPDVNDQVTYVEGSFEYICEVLGLVPVEEDAADGTAFPLDNAGLPTQTVLPKRGGTTDLKFLVTVNDDASEPYLVNKGEVLQNGRGPGFPFKAKTPLVPPLEWIPTPTGNCMQDNWQNNGRIGSLTCTAKEVFLEPNSLEASKPHQCVKGQPITLNLKATVHFNGESLYDPGWYVATDGGDAMTGQCAISYLDSKYVGAMTLVESTASNIPTASVSWDEDEGANDECGDIHTLSGTAAAGGVFKYNMVVETPLTCQDSDGNGKMDVSICFTWRKPGFDSLCDVHSKLEAGQPPTLYPGSRTGSCFCAEYEIPNVIVLDPGDKVYPC